MKTIACLSCLAITVAVSAASPNPKSDGTVLLLDDHTIARTKNLTQKIFPTQKHPANPVLRRTEKWEGVGPYLWGNRLMQDEKSSGVPAKTVSIPRPATGNTLP